MGAPSIDIVFITTDLLYRMIPDVTELVPGELYVQ